jgi:16S rRNA (cytosine1402-N4)-methyltransferase
VEERDLMNTDMSRPHISVMLDEVLDALALEDGQTYVDGTFGAGGYSEAILDAANCTLIAIDRDPNVMPHVARLSGCFGKLADLMSEYGLLKLDGLVLDLGVSSMQLDEAERGFSFMRDGPLDMRMSQDGLSAADVVNEFDATDIAQILFVYGDERRSRAIARAIIDRRNMSPIMRTSELVDVVTSVLGPHRGKGSHPATRTFQALRIFVNDELGELLDGLIAAEHCLAPGGRLAVVSFHSLEDRLVKKFLSIRSGQSGQGSRHLPALDVLPPSFDLISRKGAVATNEEVLVNPRSRSARLRGAIRTEASPWPAEDILPRLDARKELRA